MRDKTSDTIAALDCCESLAVLRDEIGIAMDCISRDALGEFELSLWRQEMLCAQIKRAIGSNSAPYATREMQQQVREMCIGLKSRSASYAALVQKGNRSSRILRDLCDLYGSSRARSKRSNSSSLSCEA